MPQQIGLHMCGTTLSPRPPPPPQSVAKNLGWRYIQTSHSLTHLLVHTHTGWHTERLYGVRPANCNCSWAELKLFSGALVSGADCPQTVKKLIPKKIHSEPDSSAPLPGRRLRHPGTSPPLKKRTRETCKNQLTLSCTSGVCLKLFVFMYVRMYACTHGCMHASMYACMHVSM